MRPQPAKVVSTHSRPKAAGYGLRGGGKMTNKFQHTAARRRLVVPLADGGADDVVSTHSRPKAAGIGPVLSFGRIVVSTHSRPKAAGC